MIEKNRNDFPNINQTDRVFDCDGTLVKVRMKRNDIHRNNLITNPQAITLNITGSACDGQGNALQRADGRFYICSKAHTISLEGMRDMNLTDIITSMIEECCQMTVDQKNKIEEISAIVNYWGSPTENFMGRLNNGTS